MSKCESRSEAGQVVGWGWSRLKTGCQVAVLTLGVGLALPAVFGSAGSGGPAHVPGSFALAAQSVDLDEVVAALDDARYAQARTLLETWWEEAEARTGGRASRDDRQQALWLRARLSPDPTQAELDYRRLVVEFPGGRYSDQALLRLAHHAEAREDAEDARRYLDILIRDYSNSPYRVEARDRLANLPTGAGTGRDDIVDASVLPDVSGVVSRADPDTVLDPDPLPIPDPDTIPDPDVLPDPDTLPDPVILPDPDSLQVDPPDPDLVRQDTVADTGTEELSGAYTVQLGAFSSRERAEDLANEARAAGLQVRVVQVEGSLLHRVRWRAFESESAAREALSEPRGRGLDALVSSDREEEVPSGGS